MGNISTIFHKQFDKLFQLTNNYQQAVFLDKCIYWWQISKYTLNDNNIYFTRAYSQLADDVNISESSVNRYLKKFEDNGFIERKTKLSGCSKDEYKVIKRTYIRICDKLLNLLNTGSQKEEASITQKSSFCEQPDIIDNVTETVSIYKDKDFGDNQKILNWFF